MQSILGLLRSRRNQLQALVGDLNTIHPNVTAYIAKLKAKGEHEPNPQFPPEMIPLLLDAHYVDCYRTLHSTTPGYTDKLPTLSLRLDYIFASPPFAQHLLSCDIVPEGSAENASDHLPIWAEFR